MVQLHGSIFGLQSCKGDPLHHVKEQLRPPTQVTCMTLKLFTSKSLNNKSLEEDLRSRVAENDAHHRGLGTPAAASPVHRTLAAIMCRTSGQRDVLNSTVTTHEGPIELFSSNNGMYLLNTVNAGCFGG